MQSNKWISIVPVPAGLSVLVYDGDVRVAFCQKRVCKRQSRGARANNQIVSFRWVHNRFLSSDAESC
jgi:hypothetical protein